MFSFLSGNLVGNSQGIAVIETNGIGWQLFISDKCAGHISGKKEVKLFTYLNVREDALELFGFYSQEELDIFKLLIQVSGIGPKVALSVLSAFEPEILAELILSGDAKSISTAQGVGLKTAQKLILELKDKVSKSVSLSGNKTQSKINSAVSGDIKEAVDALVVLGYPVLVATENVKAVAGNAKNLQDLIRLALKRIGQKE